MGGMKMAELYGNDSNRESDKTRNQYKNKVQIYKDRMKTGKILMATGILCIVGILSIISFGDMVLNDMVLNTVVLGIILFILCAAMIIGMILIDESEPKYEKSKKELESLGEDVQGEDVIASTLKSLPNEYMIFNNVLLNYNGQLTEMDCIVLSCYGISIVKVKDCKGVVHGLASDDVWECMKIDDSKKAYESKIENPLIEVQRQVQVLSDILDRKNICTDIQGYVVLPMAENVNVDSDNVLLNNIQLKHAILLSDKKVLSDDQIEVIKGVLTQL